MKNHAPLSHLSVIASVIFCLPVQAETIEADSVLLRLIDQVDVPARVLGALDAIHVEEGTPVAKGQLLAQIDDAEVRLDRQRVEFELAIAQRQAANDVAVRSAKKSLLFAQADYQRLHRAEEAKPRSVSDSELEKSRLDAEQAELELELAASETELAKIKENLIRSDLEQANRQVEIRRILSPIDGVVVNVVYRPGEWVKPGDQMFRIVSTHRLRADGFVAATLVKGDLRGSGVTILPELTAKVGAKFSGKIVFVSPEIDPINGQVRVWAEVENPNGQLRPGLRVKMQIQTGKSPK